MPQTNIVPGQSRTHHHLGAHANPLTRGIGSDGGAHQTRDSSKKVGLYPIRGLAWLARERQTNRPWISQSGTTQSDVSRSLSDSG